MFGLGAAYIHVYVVGTVCGSKKYGTHGSAYVVFTVGWLCVTWLCGVCINRSILETQSHIYIYYDYLILLIFYIF